MFTSEKMVKFLRENTRPAPAFGWFPWRTPMRR